MAVKLKLKPLPPTPQKPMVKEGDKVKDPYRYLIDN
jgi:hypothetical protein